MKVYRPGSGRSLSEETRPVGSFPKGATPTGIHDLAGNVWEWCADFFGEYSEASQQDPAGPSDGHGRVLRGGAFGFDAGSLRAAARNVVHPESEYDFIGFRVVWSLPGGQD